MEAGVQRRFWKGLQMTSDDIIAMAREAGWHDQLLSVSFTMPLLERLVTIAEDAQAKRMFEEGMVTVGYMREQIAAERNKIAAWMMAQGYATGHGDTTEDLLKELEWQISENWMRGMVNGVQAEREACAEVSESFDACEPKHIAAAIRARGQS